MELKPRYILGFSKIIIFLISILVVFNLWAYLDTGRLPSDWFVFLIVYLILLVGLPLFIWLFKVPEYIIADENGIKIKFPFRKERYILFEDIRIFGGGFWREILIIKSFDGHRLQFIKYFYSREMWESLADLIESKCPGKKNPWYKFWRL